FEPQPALDVADGQLLDWVGTEHNSLRRFPQKLPPNGRSRAVNAGEVHFSRQWTRLTQSGAAADLRPRRHPGPPLRLRQQLTPGFGDGGQDLPGPPLRCGSGVMRNNVPAPVLASARSVEDDLAAPAALGYIE